MNPTPASIVSEHRPEVPKCPEAWAAQRYINGIWQCRGFMDRQDADHFLELNRDTATRLILIPAEGTKPEMPECVRELVDDAKENVKMFREDRQSVAADFTKRSIAAVIAYYGGPNG